MSKKILVWLGLVIVLLASFRLTNQRVFSFHFVDEEDHIVTADFMNQGLKLYKDLSVNHQPLVYLGSQALQKITKPNSIYLLIKTHRLAMWAYGAIWSVILVSRFGLAGLVFSLFFEGLKFYGFGNLWLMESMVIYPTVYLFGRMIKAWLINKWPGKWESVWLGVCSFLIVFNLVPLWPWLAVVWLVLLIKNRQGFGRQLVGLVIPTIMLFILVSPTDWFRETIYYNLVYAMPQLSVIKTVQDWLKIIGFPFLAFVSKNSYQAKVMVYFFTGLLATSLIKKKYWLLVLVYLLLILANLRVPAAEKVFYEGFHLLPWTGLLLISFSVLVSRVRNRLVILALTVWGLGLFLNKNMPLFWQTESWQEYHINYSVFDDMNFAVKVLAQPGDRMAVLTSESLVYWQAGVRPATRQVVYYSWEHDVPRLKEEYEQAFYGDEPPEFIYGSHEVELVKNKYVAVLNNGQSTELFVNKDKLAKLTDEIKAKLSQRGMELDE